VRLLNRVNAELLLRSQGVHSKREIKNILSGFDFNQPAYEHQFWPDETLYQLIRQPSAREPNPATGNWFGLTGITAPGVAINSGLSGRRVAIFKTVAAFKALEGTAAALRVNLASAIGGQGGMTQVFIPRSLFWCLHSPE
jgi:hypothetical protein